MAVDPRNGDLIVQMFAADGVKLIRLPSSGGPEREISYHSDSFVIYPFPLSASAVGRDGRILVHGGTSETWNYRVGILDPSKHTVEVVPLQVDGDVAVPGWTRDGKIVSVALQYRQNLWRFRPTK